MISIRGLLTTPDLSDSGDSGATGNTLEIRLMFPQTDATEISDDDFICEVSKKQKTEKIQNYPKKNKKNEPLSPTNNYNLHPGGVVNKPP